MFTPSKYTISSSLPADIGTYLITTKVALVPSQNLDATTSFTLSIVSDCVNTFITDKTIADMIFIIGSAPATQDATFADQVASNLGITAYCGARVLTLSPATSFTSLVNSNIQVTSSSYKDAGTYTMSLKVSLADYPLVASLTKVFKVTISCNLSAISFTTAPADTTVRVGIDTQPFVLPFMTSQTPNCFVTLSFSLSP